MPHMERPNERAEATIRRSSVDEAGSDPVEVPCPPLWARKVLMHGREAWVLEDPTGIVEVADSLDVIAADHPHATMTTTDAEHGRPDRRGSV